jgi:hypothetical protein
MRRILLAVGSVVLASMFAADGAFAAQRIITVGAAEKVKIYPGGITLNARIDTGAVTSSIHAENIEHFTRNGKRWVRFDIPAADNGRKTLERRVVRMVRIKRFGGQSIRRPVVELGICLGSHFKIARVNLQDRERRKYPVLIGRRFMADVVLVNPGEEFLVPPSCRNVPKE